MLTNLETNPSSLASTDDLASGEEYAARAYRVGAQYLADVDDILDIVRAGRAETERLNRVPDATVEAMTRAGVFRAMTPLQYGGLEMAPASFFEGIMKIAGAEASAAWIGGQLNVHSFEIALMDERLQDEFWSDGPDTRASSSYAPTGSWEAVSGGYVLDGTWGFSSGVDHAQWIIVGGGDRNFVVPRSDFEIDQNSWDVAGLRGTGSKSVTMSKVFVPDYRAHVLADTYHDRNPGWEVNDRPLYRVSFLSIFNSTMANSATGAALGAFEEFIGESKVRRMRRGTGAAVTENPHLLVRLVDALSKVQMIRRRHLDNWRFLFEVACEGRTATPLERMKIRFEAADAISESLDALYTIWPVSGAGAILSNNHIQRVFRDLLAMRVHGSAGREAAASLYAHALLELPGPDFESNPSMRTLAYHR
ncbi:acyl-CoA dehydrogenase [Rhodococcus rhodochrous]|uniref:acyl-CoA dehydrogenase n=1 Tax=Rhodococcus rhodochrous TaxID=1829 RepID=UPI000750D131|nr:acyl-CoA dehydrogenase [Rhodococcus rhodochrous]MDO1484630.1 acyl-CoA dehydrogenase [Rhodococcus rhodochrous]SNV27218.1 acyl-CoA dehydrogenase [Rhodococcus rhodochrous]